MHQKKSSYNHETRQECSLTYRPPPRSERYGLLGAGNSGSQKVECTVAEGQRPRNTNDREDRAIRRVATSAPTTSLARLSSSRHPVPSRETIRLFEVGLRSRRAYHFISVDWILLTSGNLECDRRRVIFSDESRSVSVLITTAHVSGGAPASGPIRHLLSSGIQQFHKV
ncbi:hypothetical protein TNCV_2553081 [Trichonephila clavipes]|nr:hypothetical protein TNCV_2553081 [Trichonephila clavipes]